MSGVADIVEFEQERSRRVPLTDKSFETAGEMLRAVREANSISLEQASSATNVREVHLENIELMHIDALPAPAYTIGFIKAYGAFLELPIEPLVRKFKEQAGYPIEQIIPDVQSRPSNDLSGGRELSLLAVIAVVFFIIWCAFQITRPARDTQALPAQMSNYPLQQRAAIEAQRAAAEDDLFVANSDPVQKNETSGEDIAATKDITPAKDSVSERTVAEEELVPELAPAGAAVEGPVSVPAQDAGTSQNTATSAPDAAAEDEVLEDSEVAMVGALQEVVDETVSAQPIASEGTQPEQDLNLQALAATPGVEQEASTEAVSTDAITDAVVEAAPATEAVIENDFIEAIALQRVSPEMPSRCRIRGDEEAVTVAFDINTTGQVVNPRIVNSTNACFDAAALKAIAGWTFNPAIQGNDPVISTGRTTLFRFRNPQ